MLRTWTLVAVTVLGAVGVEAKVMPPGVQRAAEVAGATELSKGEKVAALKELAGKDDSRMAAIGQLAMLDAGEAMRVAAGIFRDKGSTREVKLRMGQFLLEANRPERKEFLEGFIKEFAGFLVGAVVDGGEAEFCQKLSERPYTAVGEYAYLASDFEGYKGVDFGPFKDPRVARVLLACLAAPDNVYPRKQGDVIRGKAGESTGRNTARQQIPVALARLEAVEAVEPLRRVLRDHHDRYLRDNAAYALGRLEPAGDHAKLVAELRAGKVVDAKGRMEAADRYFHLYAFGRGLLARGEEGGIEFMAFTYSSYNAFEGLSQTLYMIEQRNKDLDNVRSAKLEGYLAQALGCPRVMGMFMWDKAKVTVVDSGNGAYDLAAARERIEGVFDGMCQMMEENHLGGLRGTVETIGKGSENVRIRERGARCVEALGK